MTEIDKYVSEVLHNIHAPAAERERIASDLRAHLQAAVEAGEPAQLVLRRMGTPLEVAAEFMSQVSLPYAAWWFRLGAYVVDLVVLVLYAAVMGALATVLSSLLPQHPAGLGYALGALILFGVLSIGLAGVGGLLLYFPLLEGRFGQTIGKRLFGLYVLKENGLPIGYKEAFLRRLAFYFNFQLLDALFILFTAKRQRAFDIIARTVVVRESESVPLHLNPGVSMSAGAKAA